MEHRMPPGVHSRQNWQINKSSFHDLRTHEKQFYQTNFVHTGTVQCFPVCCKFSLTVEEVGKEIFIPTEELVPDYNIYMDQLTAVTYMNVNG